MGTYSGILAGTIPWTEDPGGLQSIKSQKSDTTQRLGTRAVLDRTGSFLLQGNVSALLLFIVVVTKSYPVLCDPMNCSTPGFPSFTLSLSLLKLMSIELVKPSNRLILCHPLLLLRLIFPTIRVFSNELALHFRWSKYWSFSFSISPSMNIPSRIDWFDLLAVQGDLLCCIIFMLQFS